MSDAHGATVHHVPAVESSGLKQPYHLVEPSPWPIIGAVGGFCTVFGIILAAHFGSYALLVIGVLIVLFTMFVWWRDVIRESRTPGLHTPFVRLGLRYGMALFIASEVMFFVGFFWAYFNFLIFPDTQGNGQIVWPPSTIHSFDPFHIPFLNTMVLLLSGCTVTWAHHSLLENDRKGLLTGLGLTIILGVCFTIGQAVEYHARALQVRRRRRVSLDLLPRHRLPRLPRHRRHLLPDRSAGSAPRPANSPRNGISASRPPPGTGTSSMWSGCSCSPASIGTAPARRSPVSTAGVAEAGVSVLHAALACRCPRCGRGDCSATCSRCAIDATSATWICVNATPGTARSSA